MTPRTTWFHLEPPDSPGAISSERWLDGWSVELAWIEIDGRQECIGVAIIGDGSKPLTARDVYRKLPIGTLIVERRRHEAELGREHPILDSTGSPVDHKFDAPRKRYSQDDYQLVADTYDEAMRLGDPYPTAYVHTKIGEPIFGMSKSATGKLVARARERGLLPPTEQRVPKGNT